MLALQQLWPLAPHIVIMPPDEPQLPSLHASPAWHMLPAQQGWAFAPHVLVTRPHTLARHWKPALQVLPTQQNIDCPPHARQAPPAHTVPAPQRGSAAQHGCETIPHPFP